MVRRGWMAVAAGALVLAGSTALAGTTEAQAAPTLTVTPLRSAPGATLTAVVANCDEEPAMTSGRSDILEQLLPTATGTPGEWSATTTASPAGGDGDVRFSARCGDVELDLVTVDVDDPWMGLAPRGSMFPPDGPPTRVYGTDCPDGTTATVVLTPDDGSAPVTLDDIPIDGFGDWDVALPDFVDGTLVSVTGSCGDVTFASLTYQLPRTVLTTTTTTTVVPPTVPPATPPPAVPRPGTASYTG